MIAVFGFIPGLPTGPFLLIAIATGFYAAILVRQSKLAKKYIGHLIIIMLSGMNNGDIEFFIGIANGMP